MQITRTKLMPENMVIEQIESDINVR